jgi:hypothetical protein
VADDGAELDVTAIPGNRADRPGHFNIRAWLNPALDELRLGRVSSLRWQAMQFATACQRKGLVT